MKYLIYFRMSPTAEWKLSNAGELESREEAMNAIGFWTRGFRYYRKCYVETKIEPAAMGEKQSAAAKTEEVA